MNQLIEIFSQPEAWVSLATLALLEIILGIDNIVFIAILSGKLPPEQRLFARRAGLGLALISRILLLFSLSWVMRLQDPLFSLFGHAFSGRDLILLGGGLFLIAKATHEIYDKVEAAHTMQEATGAAVKAGAQLTSILIQIMILDIVFSLDSVITAVGMASHIAIMVAAVIISVLVMMVFAGPIGDFVERHPSIKILALAFLVMIGAMLVAEGTGQHVPKGYIYFAMAFSLSIELLNMRFRAAQKKLETATSAPLHQE
jgi:predicted tellurium resistance membrane protein TerC